LFDKIVYCFETEQYSSTKGQKDDAMKWSERGRQRRMWEADY